MYTWPLTGAAIGRGGGLGRPTGHGHRLLKVNADVQRDRGRGLNDCRPAVVEALVAEKAVLSRIRDGALTEL